MKKKTGVLVPLSPQNLMDCSSHEGNLGCRGGYISKSYSYIIRNGGVDSESFYPYEHKVIVSTTTSILGNELRLFFFSFFLLLPFDLFLYSVFTYLLFYLLFSIYPAFCIVLLPSF